MQFLHKIDDILAAAEKTLAILFFTFLLLLILSDILIRNFFDFLTLGLMDFTPVFVLWLSLVGATLGVKYQRHIRIEILLKHCSVKIQWYAAIIINIFSTTLMGLLFMISLKFVANEVVIFGNFGYLTICFPVFFIISFFHFFTRIFNNRQS